MKSTFRFLAILLCLYCHSPLLAQGSAEGFFTSEARAIGTETGVLVSIKKYNPTQAEIDNASKPSKNAPMNYLMAPFETTSISMYDRGFESKLYSLNKEGKVLWDLTLGYSDKSTPSPIAVHKEFIYAGEAQKDAGKVRIQKIDQNGKIIWRKELDSLNNVNDILVEGDRVSALVSFDVSKKVESKDGTFYENVYPIYFFVQFNISTGEIIKKEYQKMANYMSSKGFTNPLLNSDYSYYLSNTDSAAFFTVRKVESATIVSNNPNKEYKILELAAGEDFYYSLLLKSENNKKVYSLIGDFYGKNKKYDIKLPIEYVNSDRQFISKIQGDSLAVIVGNLKYITIVVVDGEGKSALYKKTDAVISPVISAGIYSGKVFVLQVEGRLKPGTSGKLRVDYY